METLSTTSEPTAEETTMQAIWNQIEDTFEQVDHYTHGAAEMLLVMVLGGSMAVGLYCIVAAAFMGYLQLFALLTGAL